MARARKEGKAKRNRANVTKRLNRITQNQQLLKQYK